MKKEAASKPTPPDRPATADEVGLLVGALILRDHLVAMRRRQLTEGEGGGSHERTMEDLMKITGPVDTCARLAHKRADLMLEAHRLVGDAEATAAAMRARVARLSASCQPAPVEIETDPEDTE